MYGAIVKRCSVDGCNNRRQKEGLCKRHHKAMVLHSSADECSRQTRAGDVVTKRYRTKDCNNRAMVQGGVSIHHPTYAPHSDATSLTFQSTANYSRSINGSGHTSKMSGHGQWTVADIVGRVG